MSTKTDLIYNIVYRLGFLSDQDVRLAVNNILEYCSEALEKGNRIEIRGFGVFSIRQRKYSGQNKKYNTAYFRMSKHIQNELKLKSN